MKRWNFTFRKHLGKAVSFTVDANDPHTAFARAINTYLERFPYVATNHFDVVCDLVGKVPSKLKHSTGLGAVKQAEEDESIRETQFMG